MTIMQKDFEKYWLEQLRVWDMKVSSSETDIDSLNTATTFWVSRPCMLIFSSLVKATFPNRVGEEDFY